MRTLSVAFIHAVKSFGINQKVYVEYPMVNDDTGAYWPGTSEEILNPYFGERMLRCGEVTKEID